MYVNVEISIKHAVRGKIEISTIPSQGILLIMFKLRDKHNSQCLFLCNSANQDYEGLNLAL